MKNLIQCMSLSMGIYLTYISHFYMILYKKMWLDAVWVLGFTVVIMVIGCINHPDMHLDNMEYSECKKRARVTCVVELCVMAMVACFFENREYVLFMSFGIILDGMMLLIAKSIHQEGVS